MQPQSEADVEVFSRSANAWLPGSVSLLAAPGKITVCYFLQARGGNDTAVYFSEKIRIGQGKKCRKHLSPFTQMIRVEHIESEEEADPDLSFHQAESF